MEMDNILPKDLKEFSLLLTNGILGLKLGPQPWACCQNQSERDSFSCTPRIQKPGFKIKKQYIFKLPPPPPIFKSQPV